MTPVEFERAMERVVANDHITLVKARGMALIVKALGAGMPAYLPGLELLMKRLEAEPARQPKTQPEPIT